MILAYIIPLGVLVFLACAATFLPVLCAPRKPKRTRPVATFDWDDYDPNRWNLHSATDFCNSPLWGDVAGAARADTERA
jgi:hypothetical protein